MRVELAVESALRKINAAGREGVWLPSMVVPQGCKAVNRRPVVAVG